MRKGFATIPPKKEYIPSLGVTKDVVVVAVSSPETNKSPLSPRGANGSDTDKVPTPQTDLNKQTGLTKKEGESLTYLLECLTSVSDLSF